jgi:hypothetical protein
MTETKYEPLPLYQLTTKDDEFILKANAGLSQLLNNTNEVTVRYYSKTQKETITMAALFRKELHLALDNFLDRIRDGNEK